MSEGQQNNQVLQPVAMHDRYGPFLRSFFARYFNPIQFPQEAVDNIRALAGKGTLVYLTRSASLLHFLYMNHVCLRHDLPLAQFVNGVDPVLVQPVGLLYERLRILGTEEGEEVEEEEDQRCRRQLKCVLDEGRASMLFMQKPSTLTSPHETGDDGLLDMLIHSQQKSGKPIFLIPHLIVWNRHPEKETKGLPDAAFGVHESPGFLRTLYMLLRYGRNALVKVAEPVNLLEFIGGESGQDPSKLARSLKNLLRQRLSLEMYDVTGPRIRPPQEFKQEVVADKKIEDFIAAESQDDRAKAEALRKKAMDMVDEMAAEPRIRWPIALDKILNWLWRRMYEGIVVDEAGFERIRAAVRKAPLVFCPSHKSHVDYLIMSQLCLLYGVPLPHIAAGVNLSFWPMGPIFRHSGAFFMRRSFKGNPLYPVVFRTYLRHIMNEGFPIEFFIEGTRSRTGKLLSPRFGVLTWLIEAYLEGTQDDLQFMPISVDYEKLAESRAHVRELSGGDKKKEDVAGIVKSRRMLKSKHGNMYVQVSHPLSLKELLAERGLEGKQLSPEEKRSVTQEMAYRILFEINRVSTLTPSALFCFALLTHRLRGIKEDLLVERAQWAADWIKRRGHTRFSTKLNDFKWAMAEAAERFGRDGLLNMQDTGFELVYLPVEQRRLALDYYRNNIIHHFVPASIVSLALESFTVGAVPYDALSDRTRDISRLLKFEFLFRSERHFADEVRRALDDLKSEKVVAEENGFVVKVAEQEEKRHLFCAVLEHFIESYWLTARALKILRKGPLHERDFVTSALRMGDNLFVQGEIRLYESMNREVIKNALKSFEDRKIIEKEPSESRKGPVLSLLKPYDDKATLKEVAETIRNYLPRA